MLLCPSLDRPSNIARLYSVASDVPIHLWLNEGDPQLDMYTAMSINPPWKVTIGPDVLGACAVFREVFERYPEEKVYGFIGDDVVPPAESGWKEMLEEAAGDWHIAYPFDGIHEGKLCTHPFIGGELVRAVGQWAPEGIFHGFWDNYWYTIGHALGLLKYLPEIYFDHRHPDIAKAPADKVYQIPLLYRYEDQAWYHRWVMKGEGQKLIQRLHEVIPHEFQNPQFVRRDGEEPVRAGGNVRSAL